jgi:hypothetical protein
MTVSPATLLTSSSSFFIPIPADFIERLDNSIRMDLQKFSDSLFLWVWLSALIVLVGVAIEGPELLNEMWPNTFRVFSTRWVKKVGLIGWLLVVLGVAGEGIFEVVEYRAEGLLQTFNDILLADARRSAGSAKDSAEAASSAASRANHESDEASSSASNAMILAGGARKEAESFEGDIVSAKKQAAEAEKHLADALQRAVDLQEELNRLKTPRSLTNVSELVAKLSTFRGTGYSFIGVANDMESIALLKAIDSTLHDAGWIRIKLTNPTEFGVVMLDVFNNKDFGVPTTAGSGIWVMLKSPESLSILESEPDSRHPANLRAAEALHAALDASIFPTNPAENITLLKGDPSSVFILVGAKPLLEQPQTLPISKPSNTSSKQ